MSKIEVSFRDFPGTTDANRWVQFTRTDLIHAALSIGRNWRRRGITADARWAIRARVAEIRSMVEMKHSIPCASSHYLGCGSTEMAKLSFQLGNTICALIAAKERRIPWLIDLERLGGMHRITYRRGGKRADFIGRSISGSWNAFEVKGRRWEPGSKALSDWKKQAKMVRQINGRNVENIVSVAYIASDTSIHAIWKDPPADEGEVIEFPEFDFFKAYYRPLLSLLRFEGRTFEIDGQRLTHLPELGISLGIHSAVRTALEKEDVVSLLDFAKEHLSERASYFSSEGQFRNEPLETFPDGLLIRLDEEVFRPE